jgi:hypothetical protein
MANITRLGKGTSRGQGEGKGGEGKREREEGRGKGDRKWETRQPAPLPEEFKHWQVVNKHTEYKIV